MRAGSCGAINNSFEENDLFAPVPLVSARAPGAIWSRRERLQLSRSTSLDFLAMVFASTSTLIFEHGVINACDTRSPHVNNLMRDD